MTPSFRIEEYSTTYQLRRRSSPFPAPESRIKTARIYYLFVQCALRLFLHSGSYSKQSVVDSRRVGMAYEANGVIYLLFGILGILFTVLTLCAIQRHRYRSDHSIY